MKRCNVVCTIIILLLLWFVPSGLRCDTYTAPDYSCRVTVPTGPWYIDSSRKASTTNSMVLLFTAKDPVKGKIFLLAVAPVAEDVTIDPNDPISITKFSEGFDRQLVRSSEKFTTLGGLPAYAVYGTQQMSDTEKMRVCYVITLANGRAHVMGVLSRDTDPATDSEFATFTASFSFTSPPVVHKKASTTPYEKGVALGKKLAAPVILVGVAIWLAVRWRRRRSRTEGGTS